MDDLGGAFLIALFASIVIPLGLVIANLHARDWSPRYIRDDRMTEVARQQVAKSPAMLPDRDDWSAY